MSIATQLHTKKYITLAACILFSGILSILIRFLSTVLGINAPDDEKNSPYECGFSPFEDARNRFDVRFYIVAILFLIFDIEIVYRFPWASTLGLTGKTGYGIIIIFIILLIVGFIYEVIKGALNIQLINDFYNY